MAVTANEGQAVDLATLPRDFGLKATPEDFLVFERLDWEALGPLIPDPLTAPQRLLLIEKRNLNTLDLIPPLARLLDLEPVEIGYAGRKDRRAVTRQWLTVPNRAAKDVAAVTREALEVAMQAVCQQGSIQQDSLLQDSAAGDETPFVRLLLMLGCRRKLRIGGLIGNRFRVRVHLPEGTDPVRLNAALQRLQRDGVPNRFGAQRVNDAAVRDAWRLLSNRRAPRARRSWALSVLRSFLFNEVLSARLAQGQAAGMDGPLWGRGRNPASAAAAEFEAAVLEPHAALLSRLEHAGLTQARRALLVTADELCWQRLGSVLELSFALPAGSYATVLVETLLNNCYSANLVQRVQFRAEATLIEQGPSMAIDEPAVVYPWQQGGGR